MMAVRELSDDHSHFAQVPSCHHRSHVSHQRIAGISVVYGTYLTCRGSEPDNFLALCNRDGHWLLAKHVKPCLQKGLCNFEVRCIGSRDRHEVDPVFSRALSGQHFLPVAIGSVGSNSQPLSIVSTRIRAVIERASDELEFAVQSRTQPMRGADLRPFAATNHPPVELRHGLKSYRLEVFAVCTRIVYRRG